MKEFGKIIIIFLSLVLIGCFTYQDSFSSQPSKKTNSKNTAPKSLSKTYKAKAIKKTEAKKPSSKKSELPASMKKKDKKIATKESKKPKRKPVIVIDPGHGGKDPGTRGTLGTKEKSITLLYSIALKNELEKTGKYKVVLTRKDDRFIELRDRVKIARKVGGDVLISIHADSSPDEETRGFSVYTLSGRRASDEAEMLMEQSKKEEVIRGAKIKGESKDVREAIITLAQDSTKEVSDDFAKTVAKSLGRRIQALKKHNREGSLAVLTGADIPSVLIELGYLSNEYEEKLLRREDHKKKIVTSVAAAINEYFTKFDLVF